MWKKENGRGVTQCEEKYKREWREIVSRGQIDNEERWRVSGEREWEQATEGRVSRVELWRGSDGECEVGKVVSIAREDWDSTTYLNERKREKNRKRRENIKKWGRELNFVSGVGSERNKWWEEGVFTGGVRIFSDGSVKLNIKKSTYAWEAWRKEISSGKWRRIAWGGGSERVGKRGMVIDQSGGFWFLSLAMVGDR